MNKQTMLYTQIIGRAFRDQTKPPAFILDHDGKIARNPEVKITELYGDMPQAYAYVGGCKMIFSFITINRDHTIFKHTTRPTYDVERGRWMPAAFGLMVSAGVLASGVPFDPTVLHPSGFWKHAPAWANYYGIDGDGDSYWHAECPTYDDGTWDNPGGDMQFHRFYTPIGVNVEPQLYSRTMGRVK